MVVFDSRVNHSWSCAGLAYDDQSKPPHKAYKDSNINDADLCDAVCCRTKRRRTAGHMASDRPIIIILLPLGAWQIAIAMTKSKMNLTVNVIPSVSHLHNFYPSLLFFILLYFFLDLSFRGPSPNWIISYFHSARCNSLSCLSLSTPASKVSRLVDWEFESMTKLSSRCTQCTRTRHKFYMDHRHEPADIRCARLGVMWRQASYFVQDHHRLRIINSSNQSTSKKPPHR